MSFLSSGFFLSATETKLQDSPVPSAVPVVTPEEAEKLNEYALFLSTVKTTVVEGEIIEKSELPDPQKSDYPNCRFTAHFTGNSIKNGEPCPKEVVLIFEGFQNYTVLKNNEIKKGDKIECRIIPYDVLPEEEQSTQQADDLNIYTLDNYYVLSSNKISHFSDSKIMPSSGIFFSNGNNNYISIYERHINQPLSKRIIDEQAKAIETTLKLINAELENYDENQIGTINDRFKDIWNNEMKKDPDGFNRIGNIVWRNVDDSFWCLPVNYTFVPQERVLSPDIVTFFKDIKEALDANGVQLIVSLVPHMYSISSRVINKDYCHIPDIQTAMVAKQLLENGIETIYASNEILENYNKFQFAYFYPDDGHPSDTAQDVLSDILEKRIRRFYPEIQIDCLDSNLFEIKQMPHVYGDKEKFQWPTNCDIGQEEPKTSYTNREVFYDGKKLPSDPKSPFLVIGNSFIRTPMDSPCSLPTLLSYKSNYPIDYVLVYNEGPFVQFPRNLIANPERYLKDKKVLIFQVGLTHLFDMTHQFCSVKQIDEGLALLTNKKMLSTHIPKSSTEERPPVKEEILQSLRNPIFFTVGKNGEEVEIARLSLNSIDETKQIVCLVPSIAFRSSASISLCVNGLIQQVPSFYSRPDYVPLSFIIPPGTHELIITAVSNSQTKCFFAISNIQIYQ